MDRRASLCVLIAAATLTAACGSDGGGGGGGDGAGGSPGPACPAFEGPTVHTADVMADETWSAAGSPHVITQKITVRQGATLTIEPCAEVRLAEGVALQIGISGEEAFLRAEGDADRPILFTAEGEGRWEALQLLGYGTAHLAHATLEKGGLRSPNNSRGATIRGLGDGGWPPPERLEIHDVVVRDSEGLGIDLQGFTTFFAGSDGLTIVGSGDEADPYPLSVSPPGWNLIPKGSYTDNHRDEIEVQPWLRIQGDVTVRNVGVPYHLAAYPTSTLEIGTLEGHARLTLEAGVQLRIDPGMDIRVGNGASGSGPANGSLRLLGTADAPVILTSALDTPAAGDWVGIKFGGDETAADTKFEHARIAYAGGDCSCNGYGCVPAGDSEAAALLFLGSYPAQEMMSSTVIANSAGHGVLRGWRDDQSQVSFAGDDNVFEAVAGCAETVLRTESNACPDPVVCGG